MNILYICDEYPPGKNGGIGTMVQVLGRELVKQGHNVVVAGLYSYRYGELDKENDRGVTVFRLRYGLNLRLKSESRFYNLLEKLPDSIKRHLNGKKAFNSYIQFLQELIQRENIDVIEIPDWSTFNNFIGFVTSWPEFKVPLIVKSNGSHTYFSDEMNVAPDKRIYEIDHLLYKRADALASVSKYTAEKNRTLFNIKKDVEILYNSIEVPETIADTKKSEQTIVFTGTLIKKKGIYSLMKAWNLVNEKLPHAKLIIYGKGKTEPLQSLLNSAASASVIFKGHASRETLFDELSRATAAIFPSYSECFAFAPLEAMAMGCPIINSSRSSGKELIIDKENGSLIDPDNIDQIANSIIELINNRALQEKYKLNGRETVLKQFNIIGSAAQHIFYYKSVIKKFNEK